MLIRLTKRLLNYNINFVYLQYKNMWLTKIVKG